MSNRAEALRILREARELLLGRLAERVRESEEAVLDDARGESYLSEIESIHEQLGLRLIHVNQLLSSLPEEEEAAAEAPNQSEVAGGTIPVDWPRDNDQLLGIANFRNPPSSTPASPAIIYALPPPAEVRVDTSSLAPAGLTWAVFVAQMRAGEMVASARTLQQLLALPWERSVLCADVFRQRWQDDPMAVLALWSLDREIRAGRLSAAAQALEQCFELRGGEMLAVLEWLLAKAK